MRGLVCLVPRKKKAGQLLLGRSSFSPLIASNTRHICLGSSSDIVANLNLININPLLSPAHFASAAPKPFKRHIVATRAFAFPTPSLSADLDAEPLKKRPRRQQPLDRLKHTFSPIGSDPPQYFAPDELEDEDVDQDEAVIEDGVPPIADAMDMDVDVERPAEGSGVAENKKKKKHKKEKEGQVDAGSTKPPKKSRKVKASA